MPSCAALPTRAPDAMGSPNTREGLQHTNNTAPQDRDTHCTHLEARGHRIRSCRAHGRPELLAHALEGGLVCGWTVKNACDVDPNSTILFSTRMTTCTSCTHSNGPARDKMSTTQPRVSCLGVVAVVLACGQVVGQDRDHRTHTDIRHRHRRVSVDGVRGLRGYIPCLCFAHARPAHTAPQGKREPNTAT